LTNALILRTLVYMLCKVRCTYHTGICRIRWNQLHKAHSVWNAPFSFIIVNLNFHNPKDFRHFSPEI
jgi:hypothetical protein